MKIACIKGGNSYEAHQDSEYEEPSGDREEGRMRRVPDFLPVGLQDKLHGRKPELRIQALKLP